MLFNLKYTSNILPLSIMPSSSSCSPFMPAEVPESITTSLVASELACSGLADLVIYYYAVIVMAITLKAKITSQLNDRYEDTVYDNLMSSYVLIKDAYL